MYSPKLQQMAMMLDLSHSMVFKVLLFILVINIHLHEYSGTMDQFLFIQYEQSQGYISKHTKNTYLCC